MNLAEEAVIEIHAHLQAEIQRIEILREHYLVELQKLGQELRTLIRHGHGVDIAEPGWQLDAEGGKLRHIPQGLPQGGQPPALSVVPNSPPSADTPEPDAPADN